MRNLPCACTTKGNLEDTEDDGDKRRNAFDRQNCEVWKGKFSGFLSSIFENPVTSPYCAPSLGVCWPALRDRIADSNRS